jgi:hypothetical protein
MSKNKPIHEIRMGLVRAAFWAHETDGAAWHNVTFSRLFKDDNGSWKDSTSFGRDDLLLLAKVADQAHTWLSQGTAESRLPDQDDGHAGRAAG